MTIDTILEKDIIPDSMLRFGIRFLLKHRLKHESFDNEEDLNKHQNLLIEELKRSPIAINTIDANEQHYEVPASFYKLVLGPYFKYSSGYWFNKTNSIKQSEEDMLLMTIERAEITDGQSVLDLGCGWGSFSLFAAKNFPGSQFTAVSNSSSQKQFIEETAKNQGIKNLTVITADINDFNPTNHYNRIVSVEMFEHVRNYDKLFKRIYNWLTPEGKLFVHIFTHKKYAYKFETKGDSDWMAKYFFSGGMMPSRNLLIRFAEDFVLQKHWKINGTHYARTLELWLTRMDLHKKEIMQIFRVTYGDEAKKFWSYWRIFFMACAETFNYNNGNEWGVSHYLFKKA